ncbi:unnamed protein product [Arabidopsis lyrata]|nr:unnamed protein product [Arabidopsis lyrata]
MCLLSFGAVTAFAFGLTNTSFKYNRCGFAASRKKIHGGRIQSPAFCVWPWEVLTGCLFLEMLTS